MYVSPKISTNFSTNILEIISDLPVVKKNKKLCYINAPSVFDIEASSFIQDGVKKATMYAWVFGLDGRCIRGRTWGEFLSCLDVIKKAYNLSSSKRLIIYVHNLCYEFQWFRKYFIWEKVFSLVNRKPIYAITNDGIEFRCSYLLTGYSLSTLGKNLLKYKVEKKVGDLDYRLIRHSQTELTDKEWGYILNDGLVVMAHIQEEIERLGDITKLPLTKTGYVRNLCRENCFNGDNRFEFSKKIKSLTLTPETYQQLKRAFMGGFTHANANYVGKTILNVHSYDFTSSYPSVMVAEQFPMSKPYKYTPTDFKDFLSMLKSFCCVFNIRFNNIVSKRTFENYISISRTSKCEHYIINNGRIVEAELIEMTITEQDFFIISSMYSWDSIEISDFTYFYKGYLPKDFILTVLELYQKKTELKGVKGKEIEYMVSKNMINALFGMCVTDICKDEITYTDNSWEIEKIVLSEAIEKYNKDRRRFLFYAWGVWIPAYARRNLYSGILEFKDDYIYSDTDSLKILNMENHKQYIENYNKNVKEKIKKCLKHYDIPLSMAEPKTIKGVKKPLGVWDYEGKYDKFKTLGAKRYLTSKGDDFEITIAGVNKEAGKKYLKFKYDTIDNIFDNFQEDLYFPSEYCIDETIENGSGKLCHTYIDFIMEGEVVDYMGKKSYFYEDSSVYMENTDYTMSLSKDFVNYLLGLKGGHIS